MAAKQIDSTNRARLQGVVPAATLFALSGCSLDQVYAVSTVVDIDGYEHWARPVEARANIEASAWQAAEDNVFTAAASGGTSDSYAALDNRNLRATERVSGCRVDPSSITNLNRLTQAVVICV